MTVAEQNPQNVQAKPPAASRQGGVLRVAIIALVVVVVLVVGAILVFQNMRASRNAPLAYDLYPDAAKVNETTQKSADTVLYSTEAPVDQVFAFYKARMGADPLEGCQLFFTTEPPSNDPGKSFARCVLDRSQDDMTQTLKITITYDEAVQRTLIQYERQWGNQ